MSDEEDDARRADEAASLENQAIESMGALVLDYDYGEADLVKLVEAALNQ